MIRPKGTGQDSSEVGSAHPGIEKEKAFLTKMMDNRHTTNPQPPPWPGEGGGDGAQQGPETGRKEWQHEQSEGSSLAESRREWRQSQSDASPLAEQSFDEWQLVAVEIMASSAARKWCDPSSCSSCVAAHCGTKRTQEPQEIHFAG